MYTGYLLSKESKNFLLKKFPPTYPDLIGHHITEVFGVKKDVPAPQSPNKVYAIGHAVKNGVEAFLVSIDGKVNRPSGGKYHLTWSIDKSLGKKPVDSNYIIDEAILLSEPIELKVEPRVFT